MKMECNTVLPMAIPVSVSREIDKVCRAARHIIWINQTSAGAWKDEERRKTWSEIEVDVEEIVTERWHPKKDKLGLSFMFTSVSDAVDFVMHRLRAESDSIPELTSEAQMQICWCFVKQWGAYSIADAASVPPDIAIKVANENIGFLNLVRMHLRELRGTWDEVLAELHPRLRELWQFYLENKEDLPTTYGVGHTFPIFPKTADEILNVPKTD